MVAIERRAGHEVRAGVRKLVLDSETSIEAAAHAAWITALGAWTRGRVDEPRRWLRSLIPLAATGAVEKSADFVDRWWGQYPAEQVRGWIAEFAASVDESDLLREVRV